MSDIKMFSTSSDKWTKRHKGAKKYKMETKDFTFKNKNNEFCSIDSSDLVERLKGSLSRMDKGSAYEITVFFENYGNNFFSENFEI